MPGLSFSRAVLRQPGRAWSRYTAQLARAPVATKVATSAAAAVLGDALAQRLARPRGGDAAAAWSYDWPRTARLAAFNAFLGGLGHHYFAALESSILPSKPTAPAAVLAKLAVDQLLWAPACTGVFYAYKCAAEGRPGELRAELRKKYRPTLLAGWCLWPAANLASFALVPTRHRILYANVVSIFGTYLLSRAAAGDFSGGGGGEAIINGVVKAD